MSSITRYYINVFVLHYFYYLLFSNVVEKSKNNKMYIWMNEKQERPRDAITKNPKKKLALSSLKLSMD